MALTAQRYRWMARFVACFALVAVALAATGAAVMAQAYCANPLYLGTSGENVDACGSEEAPCASIDYAASRALSCSTELGEEITILQLADEGSFAVGLANASGLAGAPAIGDPQEPAEEAATEESAETEAGSEEAAGEEAAGEEMAEEGAEDGGAGWMASRDDALFSILALIAGAVLGVVIAYGTRTGATAAAAVAICIASGVALAPATVYAQEQCPGEFAFYSSEAGEDVAACGTAEEPCQTFEYVLSQAEACTHGVTIYQDDTPVFTLELSSSTGEVGDGTVSEIGDSASNVEVADEVDTDGAAEEAAEEVAAEVVEALETIPPIVGNEAEGALDWAWLIGMLAVGALLGVAAHALPTAKV